MMRFGGCNTPWWQHGWTAQIPDVNAYKFLHDTVGITDMRISIPLALLFPDPKVENWILIDNFISPLTKAGIHIYCNPNGCPPFASNNQPAYIGSVAGWPPETPVPPAVLGGTSYWDDPTNPDPNHIHFFGDPKFTAIDSKLSPRPYLLDPPHINPAFIEEFAGYRITQKYGGAIDSCGIGNEPGSNGDPVMRQDTIAFGGTLGDTIKNRFWPEQVVPYTDGVIRADPNMWLVGPEADSDSVLDRLCELDNLDYRSRPSVSRYDLLSIHPYGDLIGGTYRTMDAFNKVLDHWKGNRSVRIGEISGDPQAVYDWSVATISKNPYLDGIYYLNFENLFFEAGSWPKTPVLSAVGNKFKTLFAQVNFK